MSCFQSVFTLEGVFHRECARVRFLEIFTFTCLNATECLYYCIHGLIMRGSFGCLQLFQKSDAIFAYLWPLFSVHCNDFYRIL